jgi:hypothetical protein
MIIRRRDLRRTAGDVDVLSIYLSRPILGLFQGFRYAALDPVAERWVPLLVSTTEKKRIDQL